MVGEGVLLEALRRPDVGQVLVIGRRPCGHSHPKLKEIIHSNFCDLSPITSQLAGYNACFYCLGVSSVGMKKAEYAHITYDMTIHVAETLQSLNPDMTFCYVTGAGTDSSEKGRMAWARVKGRTENQLLRMPFKDAYMFRPGFMKAAPGALNTQKYYRWFAWMYPAVRKLGIACTLTEVGQAMIHAAQRGYSKRVLEVKDIIELAKA